MTFELPLIVCLCPTYKRPALLANAVACFESQDYPTDRRCLAIMDDALQFDVQTGNRWHVFSSRWRYPSLPAKFNTLAGFAPDADILVPWEDDDVFLPNHLSQIAAAYAIGGPGYFTAREVWSNYGLPKDGSVQREPAAGRFHSSWAFTREVFERAGGYPDTGRLDFDQQFGSRLRKAAGGTTHYDAAGPSYVYRWGNGIYHGSQAGEAGFKALWDELGRRPAPWIGRLAPQFDDETRAIYESTSPSDTNKSHPAGRSRSPSA